MTDAHCTSKTPFVALTDPKRQGPASSDSDAPTPGAFKEIPFDVKDRILSLIDSSIDLLSLSLTSREWSAMILPIHIRYRELRIRANQPEVWQHLATRTDLSKNIRKVCLMKPNDRRDQRLPLIVGRVMENLSIPTHEIHPQPGMIQALSHFESMASFTWLRSGPLCQYTEEVFGALTNCHRLVELMLGTVCPRKNHLNPESSIWRIRNLRILVLNGLDWVSLGDAEYSFMSMLNNSPALEELTIPYNNSSVKFTSCRFRSLIKLHLDARSNTGLTFISNGDFLTTNKPIIDFLDAHPTIQELSWYPFGPYPDFLPQGLLPTLKHLSTHHLVAAALLCDNTVIKSRMLETISQISLDYNTMRLFGTINGSRLQEIRLRRCEPHAGIDIIRRLAVLFPTIKTLAILGRNVSLDTNNKHALDEYIDCFGEFPLLENLYDGPLWRAIHSSKTDKKEEIIRKLYTRCSSLKTVRAMMELREEIVFFRDGLDVTWQLRVVKDS